MAGWKCLAVVLMFTYISALPLDADSKDIRTPVDPASDKVKTINLKMKGAHPTEDDAYLCSSYSMENLPEDVNYIVQFEAKADVKIAHHILLFGCDGDPARSHDIWKCPAVCSHDAQEQILFAWAKAAPPTKLPPDVGYRVGRKSTIKNIVLQVHYKHKFNESAGKDYSGIKVYVTPEKQKYVAGIYLLLSMYVNIPPNTPVTHADISCEFDMEKPIHPFAYRTHAHSLGKVISGYVYNESWYEIGKGNPQWPQAFYPTKGNYVVKPGDKMVARCTYDSIGRNRVTHIGATGRDEMCNFYIMFYTDSDVKTPYHQCNGDNLRSLVEDIPADSDKPLPPNPALEEEAKGHHHSPHPSQSSEPSAKSPEALHHDTAWPHSNIKYGQVGGVATDKDGNVYIFHRGARKWTEYTFDNFNKLLTTEPIAENTIVILDKDGKLIREFGSNQFYMPHGIEVDMKGNIWITDLGLHQVMRIPKDASAPDLIVGKAFEPGSDNEHFCKPSDIAVMESGDFFVSDGYCNSRVLKFTSNGTLLDEWGQSGYTPPGMGDVPAGIFSIVHSITVAEDKNLVCAADRENGRIQCFDLDGKFRYIVKDNSFGSRLFAIEYCPLHGGLLFAVNGPSFDGPREKVQGFTVDVDSGEVLQKWNIEKGLEDPHDIAVDPSNHAVYVGELIGRVSRLAMDVKGSTNTVIDVPEKKGFTSKPDITPKSPGAVSDTSDKSASDGKKDKEEKESKYFASIIIGVMLIVPVVILLVVTIIIRLHQSGKISCFTGRKPKVFSLQSFLGNSHKGFDRLSTEESDHELDPLDDSDQEEYTAPSRKQKA